MGELGDEGSLDAGQSGGGPSPSDVAAAVSQVMGFLEICDGDFEGAGAAFGGGSRAALVYNLCTLYDLESDQSAKKKRVVKEMVERFLGDDFPQDTLKL
eukprot:gene834-22974_t